MSGHLFADGRPSGKWACLSCRRVSKRVWKPGAPILACALCRAPLRCVGKYFAAPRRGDREQWRKVAALLESGVVFNERDLSEPRPPKYLSELPAFLDERRERDRLAAYESEQHRAGARARHKKRERQRQKRAAQKRRFDKIIERAARSASPATST